MTEKSSTPGNPMSNTVLEQIHQVLGNLARAFNISQIYIDEDYPWLGILSAGFFTIFSTINIQKGYSLVQLIFGHDMILLIEHTVDW